MKKSIISILLAGTMFLSSPWSINPKNNYLYHINNQKEINKFIIRKEEPIIKIKEDSKISEVKKDDSTEYKKIDYSKLIPLYLDYQDQKYLYENTKEINLFLNEKELKDSITNILRNNEHTYRKDNPINEDYSQIKELSLRQTKVLYLMLNSLKDSALINKIGKIIYDDIKDNFSEKGGIVNFKEKEKIDLECIESEGRKECEMNNDLSGNNNYSISSKAYKSKKIGYFHLHAGQYNEEKFAGPSSKDIDITELSYGVTNWINEFIITSIEKGKFNIDYLGVDFKKDKQSKTIDIGNYSYDTLEIK